MLRLKSRSLGIQAEKMSKIGSFEGFQPVSLKQEGDDQPSETDQLSTEEGDPGKDPEPSRISRQPSVTESTLYPNPYHQPYVSRKYFVTRPGAIETAMEDLKGHMAKTPGETIQGFWLLTEIDHWNNEKERILLVTDKTLLICKYDFIMLSCVQLQRIPLSTVYRICLGKFVFPGMSLDKRQGEGLRIYWGSLEQQSLLSRWNPWSTEVPYATFTEHPMKYTSEKFLEICKTEAQAKPYFCVGLHYLASVNCLGSRLNLLQRSRMPTRIPLDLEEERD
ncbi:tumor protein p63-regulated gene 1 protein isoform X3 [Panthera leo]|uniref:tumor protein p63-regulated gene 1 protein isoform X3 n=1 Tax=Panthera leo TaxID=9689 RepID=UPI001C6995D0|nr:tumor protein p63-regulated gene 1 protein isoform X3 [Panthera leo]